MSADEPNRRESMEQPLRAEGGVDSRSFNEQAGGPPRTSGSSSANMAPAALPAKALRAKALLMILGLASLNGVLWPYSIWEQRVKQQLDERQVCQSDPDQCHDFGQAIIFPMLVGLGPLLGPVVGPRLGSGAVPPHVFARYATALVVGGYLVGALALYVRKDWLLFVGFAVPCGIGAGIGFITTVLCLVQWYVATGNKPGKGSGLQGACQGGMGVVFSQIQYWLLYGDIGNRREVGKDGAGSGADFAGQSPLHVSLVMVIMAVSVLACSLPACMGLTMPPRPTGLGADGPPPPRSKLAPRDIASTSTYWVFFAALVLGEIPGWALQSFIAPLVTESLHSPAYYSTCILSAFLAFFSVGRLTCGMLGDRVGALRVWQVATGVQAVCVLGVALLFRHSQQAGAGGGKLPAGPFAGVLVLVTLAGVCFAAVKVSVPGLLAGAWGRPAHVSPVMGVTGPAITVAAVVGSVAIYYTHHDGANAGNSTSANPFLYACVAMSLLSLGLVTKLPKPPADTPNL
eukprot:g4466.t1